MSGEDTLFDVIVIGGGPAGAVASAGLARAGKKVVVLEKLTFPRFIIGESLLPASNDIMERVGLFDAVAKAGFLKKEGALFFKGEKTERFNFAETVSEDQSDFAYQVPRGDFDKLLIDTAASFGADVRFLSEVTGVTTNAEGVSVDVRDLAKGEEYTLTGAYVIDCSGYGRAMATYKDLSAPSDLDYRESLFTHVKNDKRPQGSEEGYIWIVVLPQGGWIWVIPFSNGLTSVGVVAAPGVYDAESGTDDEILRKLLLQEESLQERLGDMEFTFPARRIKGYSVSIKSLFGERYLMTGNATEFLDPVFSSGVTLAMESAHRAQELVIRALDGEKIDFGKEYEEYVMKGVNCFRTYVKGWYTKELQWLFFNDQKPDKIKRKICSVLAGYVWDEKNSFAAQSDDAMEAAVATVPDELRF